MRWKRTAIVLSDYGEGFNASPSGKFRQQILEAHGKSTREERSWPFNHEAHWEQAGIRHTLMDGADIYDWTNSAGELWLLTNAPEGSLMRLSPLDYRVRGTLISWRTVWVTPLLTWMLFSGILGAAYLKQHYPGVVTVLNGVAIFAFVTAVVSAFMLFTLVVTGVHRVFGGPLKDDKYHQRSHIQYY